MMSLSSAGLKFSAALLLLCLSVGTAARAQTGEDWRGLYLKDLAAARDTIAADHPGMVDAENPAFARAMEAAFAEASAAAPLVKGYDSYRVALTRFANRFQDEHLSITFSRPFESVREAGVYTLYEGGEFVVEEVDARYGAGGEGLRGARLVGCDGTEARELFRGRVLSWRGRESVEADWHKLAPLLFVDYGPPAQTAVPSSCRFRAGGRTLTLQLKWGAAASKDVAERVARLTSPGERALGLERLEGGRVLWANVPTFGVDGEEQVKRMRALVESLGEELKLNKTWRLLVFDLRGNSGGSSVWGGQLAAAVFGAGWAEKTEAWLNDGVYTEWRVSEGNVAALRGIVRQQEQRHGAGSEGVKYFRAFADSMAEALKRGKPLIGEAKRRAGRARPSPSKVPGKVVLLTSASCFSACLDFLDTMRLHPSAVQAGQTTGVDTVYMENWGKPLPGGVARVNYPMKVYRNRRRANNEAYAPHAPYAGRIGDTEKVRAWVLKKFM